MTTDTWITIGVEVGVQIIGFGAILFRSGKFMGQTNEMFLGIFRNMARIEKVHDEHVLEDDRKHEHATSQIADLRVEMARAANRGQQ